MSKTQHSDDAKHFKSKLQQLGETEASFSKFMQSMGDDREESVITKSLSRISNGETKFSGELKIILNMSLLIQKRVNDIQWTEKATGEIEGITWDDFKITITKKSNKWHVKILHKPSDYSVNNSEWGYTVMAAKIIALKKIDDARSDKSWERNNNGIILFINPEEYYSLREWIYSPTRKYTSQVDKLLCENAENIFLDIFKRYGLHLRNDDVKDDLMAKIKFVIGPHNNNLAVLVPVYFFDNPPKEIEQTALPDHLKH